jgi:hypothetical protein
MGRWRGKQARFVPRCITVFSWKNGSTRRVGQANCHDYTTKKRPEDFNFVCNIIRFAMFQARRVTSSLNSPAFFVFLRVFNPLVLRWRSALTFQH